MGMTVRFSLTEEDLVRLERLERTRGRGNRSRLLREAPRGHGAL